MKFLVSIFFIAAVSLVVYFLLSRMPNSSKKQKKINRKAVSITALVALVLLSLLAIAMYRSATAPDVWCSSSRPPSSQPPANLVTANDYFLQGNYDYDTGYCKKAVVDYTNAISLNPNYAQAYNNRGYTYMRLQDYKNALPDLNKAIELNPNYVQALMNRGDIYNYYYQINKAAAITDYQKVISINGGAGTSVCGHLLLAKHDGWSPGAVLDILVGRLRDCN